MLRRSLALCLVLLPCLAGGAAPAPAQPAKVRLDLTGRWGLQPLVVQYYCYQYRRSGYIDLSPKPGNRRGIYFGRAFYVIDRVPTNEPGCLPFPRTQHDRVTVEVLPCHIEELPRVRRRARRGPCFHAHFSASLLRIGYAAEVWIPRKGHLLIWGARFAKRYNSYYSRITPPGG